MHTVSVIFAHGEEGAYGLVINKRSSLTIDRLLIDHPVFRELALPVWWGGPVGTNTLQIIHRLPDELPGGQEIADGLHVGGELDDFARLVERVDPRKLGQKARFVLGYAGWGDGQLEMELRCGSWIPLPLNPELVFRDQQEATWQEAVRSLGERGRDLADLPPDIRWN
jgi:putative transcriptional regulator